MSTLFYKTKNDAVAAIASLPSLHTHAACLHQPSLLRYASLIRQKMSPIYSEFLENIHQKDLATKHDYDHYRWEHQQMHLEQVDLSILVIATEVYLQTRVASNIGFYVFSFVQ